MADGDSFDQRLEMADDEPVARETAPSLGDIWQRRIARRGVLKGMRNAALLATAASAPLALAACDDSNDAGKAAETAEPETPNPTRFKFAEIEHGVDETHHVARGYRAEPLLRWGDPVVKGAPDFDPMNQTAATQRLQFGYNNDFVGFVPLPYGSGASDRGLLCVNHEFTSDPVMLPGIAGKDPREVLTRDEVNVTMAAHGSSIVEIRRNEEGHWEPVPDSDFNRRITALDTEMDIAGPAAHHPRMRTSEDPTGGTVIGTFNNCAGGITPWGTYLMAEENVNMYFMGDPAGHPEADKLKRMALPTTIYAWGRFHKRFNINEEPNEPNRFGWVVEVDPLNPQSRPKKRTALGRFKHEGCESIVAKDGRLVVYMGDDQRFEYLYKFVSRDPVDPVNRAANTDLLDYGTLYVARFDEDGSGKWLPLVYGWSPLTEENGFHSQADVVIDARFAADKLGATPLDRPEDVQPNPLTNRVYVSLTNNSKRKEDQTDKANPRAKNKWGQIVEINPFAQDHTEDSFGWDMVVLCGNPADKATGATWNEETSENGWFACPDNLAVDKSGRLWVATDQGGEWPEVTGSADGIFALETEGEYRGTGRMFFRVPVGAEMCGPCFTPDSTTFFVAVQHPGTDGTKSFKGFERASTFEDPATRWPDFKDEMPPRPSVVVITRKDGGEIAV